MADNKPLTDKQKEKMVELHGQGFSLHQIAKELDKSKGTIWRHANRMGLSFDRSQTAEATKARQEDLKAKRVELEENLINDAITLREDLYREFEIYAFDVKNGQFAFDVLEELPPREKAEVTKAIMTLINSANKLAEVGGGSSEDDSRSMLAQTLSGLKIVVTAEEARDDESGAKSEAD